MHAVISVGSAIVRTWAAAQAPRGRNLSLWASVIFAVALTLFLVGISSAKDIYFDETWYVPTAREWLKSGEILHQEHPPLAKFLIAAGMAIFGDTPFGWRFMSAVFGAVTLVGVMVWTYALLESIPAAIWVATVTFLDGVLFVQARIAMLDVFLLAFMSFALGFFTLSLKQTSKRIEIIYVIATGICLGLAGACKWSGWFLAYGLLAFVLLNMLLRHWRVRFDDPRTTDFYLPDVRFAWRPVNAVIGFGVAPFLAYFVCYLPQVIHARSLFEFYATHKRMIEIMSGHSPDHPYMSLWYTWPVMSRPIWYLFDAPGANASGWSAEHPAQAVVGLANRAVLFFGELALMLAIARWLGRRELGPAIVVVAFFSQFLPWALNPKGLEFFYYFFPSIICLGPALGLALFAESSRGARAARADSRDLSGEFLLFPSDLGGRDRSFSRRFQRENVVALLALRVERCRIDWPMRCRLHELSARCASSADPSRRVRLHSHHSFFLFRRILHLRSAL